MMAIGCEREDNPPDNTVSVVGTWVLHMENDAEILTLDAEMGYTLLQQVFYKEEGTYIYRNDTLTLAPTKAWTRDYVRDDVYGGPVLDENGQLQYTEWQETDPMGDVRACKIRMIYSGDVMMQEGVSYFDETPRTLWAPYVKEDATHVSNVNDIQGKWYWMFENRIPRVIVNVDGNNGEVIITPWGERYVGPIRYEKGVIYMENPTFYTSRYDDENGEWEHMNYEDPESTPWRIPSPDNPYASHGIFDGFLSVGFVVDGNVAYGGIANLLADFYKQ